MIMSYSKLLILTDGSSSWYVSVDVAGKNLPHATLFYVAVTQSFSLGAQFVRLRSRCAPSGLPMHAVRVSSVARGGNFRICLSKSSKALLRLKLQDSE